jgi:hypothetical protein
MTTNTLGPHRLFVPLSTEPFEWFSSQGKQWEVRRNKGSFRADRLTPGRRVELRRGYTGDSLWGTLTETVRASSAADLFDVICYKTAVPSANSQSEAIAFVDKLLAQNHELVAFRVELDTEPVNEKIAFDPALLGLVDSGNKTTTIRAAHRDFRLGPAVLYFGPSHRRNAAIIRTQHMSLDDLTIQHARTDGYDSLDDLLAALRGYYPDLAPGAPVTLVEFRCRPE